MSNHLVRLVLVALALASPAAALAQTGSSAIAGVVRDATGANVPGVTVEASSPALIEKSRTAVTNEAGQYRVVDLRPGVYTVTFTLSGFATVVREGIQLESNFVAPVNIEMTVAGIEQSITVTGSSPIVDVQSSQRREVVNSELLAALPTGRSYVTMAATVPAVLTGQFDVGGSTSMWQGGSLTVHGSLNNDSRTLIDGMVADAMFAGGQCACVYDNEAQTQEIAVQVSGGNAESQLSGVLVNRIPRTGGNKFSGDFMTNFANTSLWSQNTDADLALRGFTVPAKLYRQYDINYTVDGPIIKDRLWFFFSGRNWAYNNYVGGAVNPDGTQAIDDNNIHAFPVRLTGQLTPKNKVTAMFDWSEKRRGHANLSGTIAPEASLVQSQPAQHIAQAKWTSTLSNHLLLEAGYHQTFNNAKYEFEPEVILGTCHTAFDLCAPGTGYGSIPHQDLTLGTNTVAAVTGTGVQTGPQKMPTMSHYIQSSLSYVSGSHSLKVGFQQRFGWQQDTRTGINADLIQQYRSGAPTQVTIFNTPTASRNEVDADLGIFVQDTWTRGRLTLNPGLRFDYFRTSIPEQSVPAGRFVPARQFAANDDLESWKNVSPRFGVSYDLFGNGATAIKGNLGSYVQSQGTGFAATYNPMVISTDVRTWTDANRDDIAQESELGPTSNRTFGIRQNQNPAPGIKRPYQWVYDVAFQHELARGVGVSVSYNRRHFFETLWTQNLAAPLSAYTLTSVPDPQQAGQTIPIYNLAPSALGLVDLFDDNSSNNRMYYQGVDVTVNLRFRGATVNGGTSTGRTLSVTCDVQDPNNLRFCDQTTYDVPFRTLFRLSGTYGLPFGVRASAVFQSIPGAARQLTYVVTKTQLPTLTQASVTARLNQPNTLFLDTVTQLDLSFSKAVRAGAVEVRPEVGVFNALNANPVTAQTNAFGLALDRVTAILPGRLIRLGMTVKF
ncbi:MAG: carboxypeptidase regulatory-like domain-containing protein [Acidobacteriota bacterium]